MATITYYTKSGCLTSAKQVELLRQAGHQVEVMDLLAHDWQPEELSAYFGQLPVERWFNPNSPRVKSGEIDPKGHDAAGAMKLLTADHLLIRRPLMISGGTRMCGFDPVLVHAWVGLAAPAEALSRSAELQSCSQPSAKQICP